MSFAKWITLAGCLLVRSAVAVSLPEPDAAALGGYGSLPRDYWYEFTSPHSDGVVDEDGEGDGLVSGSTAEPPPQLERSADDSIENVTTQLGGRVHLHCRVNQLRERTVSWVRRKGDELHLITFGRHTYSSDSRYSLDYQPPNDWRLLIQFANERDEGNYECRVNSRPPLSLPVHLSVVVPRVEIVDERGLSVPDKFYKAGSTIELKCVISKVPQPSGYVTWKHGARMLNYDTSRGGISVKTDLLPGGAMSRLYIANANRLDSGNYSCSLADVAGTTVAVHVLNGENPAAMQHGGCGRWAPLALHRAILALLPPLLAMR